MQAEATTEPQEQKGSEAEEDTIHLQKQLAGAEHRIKQLEELITTVVRPKTAGDVLQQV